MVTLDLSRVDRKAQGPLELVFYWSLLVPLQATCSTFNMSPCDLVLLITMKHHWFLCLNGIVQVGVMIDKNTKA